MVHPELLAYLREQSAAGAPTADAAAAARQAGWSDEDVSAALAALQSAAPWAAVERPGAPIGSDGAGITSAPSEGGLIGLVMRLPMVRTREQANTVLAGLAIAALAIMVWNMLPHGPIGPAAAPPPPGTTPATPK